MKVKFTFLALLICFFIGAQAQNVVINGNLETWSGDTPDGWDLANGITPESNTIHGGSFAAKHTSADASQKFQQNVTIEAGTTYTISYWYYDNDPTARTRIWSYWLDASGATLENDADILRPSEYSVEDANWKQFSAELTAPMGAAKFRFEVRVYKQDGNFGGSVYYDDFVVSGDVVIKPEPTNYPTNFAAQLSGVGANLSWTDATGEQLPDGYLIIGSKGSISVPQDGVAVTNNLDPNQGTLTYNIGYGSASFAFNELEGNSNYTFAIFPYTNNGENIDYKNSSTYPTVQVITQSYNVMFFEPFNTDLGQMDNFDALGDQVWEWADYDGGCAKASGYSGAPFANEDWLITPDIQLPIGNYFSHIYFSFKNAYRYDGDPLQVLISVDYEPGNEPSDYSWEDISNLVTWSEGNFVWAESGDIDIVEYVENESNFNVAFKYTSNTTAASTWEIDDIKIISFDPVGLEDKPVEKVSVYPNPTTNNIQFDLKRDATVTVMDLTGRTVISEQMNAGISKLDVSNLVNGMYIINFEYIDGTSTSNKFSKR